MPADVNQPETAPESSSWRERQQERIEANRPTPSRSEQFVGMLLLVIFALAATVGTSLVLGGADIGGAITLGLPIALGIAAGLLARDLGRILLILIVATLIGVVLVTLLSAKEIGPFCACVYGTLAFTPAFLVALATLSLRRWQRRRRHTKRTARSNALLLIGAFALPLVWRAAERTWPPAHAPESMEAVRVVDAPLEAVWESRLAFPNAGTLAAEAIHAPLPRGSDGCAHAVGDVKRLLFSKGAIIVRIVRVEAGREFVAEVIEQTVEQRALRIETVTLACEPLASGRTQLRVRIDFTPLMGPRWYWRPFERWFGAITFDALLDGWERAAESSSPPAAQAHAPP